MPNRCTFCTIIKPTNHLLLPNPNGLDWIEFCERCGEQETLINRENGEIKSVRELYDDATQARINKERKGS
tara:strand:- start:161 stop:373 length:213 start_codon:yes stop_codon:yes gene_type:complete